MNSTDESHELEEVARRGTRPHWTALSLLLLPPLMCCAIVSLVDYVPSGRNGAIFQIALLSVIPLGLALGTAIWIAEYLSGSNRFGRVAVCLVELIAIVLSWQACVPLFLRSWR